MDRQFDELSKSLAEGVSRREALRKFGTGLAGVLLAAVGLVGKAHGDPSPAPGGCVCKRADCGCPAGDTFCLNTCRWPAAGQRYPICKGNTPCGRGY